MTLRRHIAAVVAVLALGAGNVAVCAGWQATPEARMACCMSDTTCPMHKSEGDDHSPKRVFSQTQANNCCAASSQRRDSSAAGSLFASSGVIALVPAPPFIAPAAPAMAQGWRPRVPLPVSSRPKHLLLAVLLV